MVHNEVQTGSTTEITRLSKGQIITLRTIIIIQMAHTLLWLVVDAPDRFVRVILSPGPRRTEMVPLGEALASGWIFTLLSALIIEVALLRSLCKRESWVWIGTLLLLIDANIYMFWTQQFDSPVMVGIEIGLLLASPIGYLSLWNSRKAFAIRRIDFWQVPFALILAAVVIFISGFYFPRGTGWELLPPLWFRIPIDSQFSFPQERSLVLMWGCYAAVAAFVWLIAKARRRAGG